ncbi:MAG TPA: flagellar biosynthesis protein FlhB [Dongiaceae bacterium]|jgi:flagellar biosynthetic protein FlhB|nr:flagellar biosynthesis protein FlhB [Dongiaceae bacterium]
MAEESQDDSEKTEEPTGKRLDDARREGNVAQSREVNSLVILALLALIVFMFVPDELRELGRMLAQFLAQADRFHLDIGALERLGWNILRSLLRIAAIPLVLLVLGAIGAGYAQFGFLWSGKHVAPDLSRLSPLAGLGRIFSRRSLVEFGKGLGKIGLAGWAAYWAIAIDRARLNEAMLLTPLALLSRLHFFMGKMVLASGAVVAGIAVTDYLYQRFDYLRTLRLSRHELREELKETEGNPLIKARLRQLRQERARRRMMNAVPGADVILVNPSHYAVALSYQADKMNAPRLIAKGVDHLAQKIRALAEEHRIPIIENPPLARGLYARVEIGAEIPAEFYKAIAEIIAYVFRLKNRQL